MPPALATELWRRFSDLLDHLCDAVCGSGTGSSTGNNGSFHQPPTSTPGI
jgi:hypothetical protein